MRIKTVIVSIVLILFGLSILLFIGTQPSLTGFFSFEEIAPEGFEFEPPEDVSEEMASQAIQDARLEIAEMKQQDFTTTFVDDVLNEANIQYEQGDYGEVLKMAGLISFINEKKVEFLDRVALTEIKEREYQDKKVDTSEGQALVGLAMEAFAQDQLVDAQELLQQADTTLENAKAEKERQRSIAYLSKNFILKYWWQIILVIVVIAIISPPITKKVIKKKRKKKLAGLKAELTKTDEMIGELQKSCFVDKKITPKTYKKKVAKYEERIAEIKHTIPVLEAQLTGKKAPPKKEEPKGVIEVKK